MSDKRHGNGPQPGLCLYWYETKKDQEPRIWWGQLAGAMLRLIAVQQELETLGRQRDIESELRRLELCIESYMLRAFEIRERALGLLASRTNRKKKVEKLRHPQKRGEALVILKALEPKLTVRVESLLLLLDKEVKLRNLHTHRLYPRLGLNTGADIFDPYDALIDVSNDRAAHAKLKVLLRSEMKKMANRYIEKVKLLHKAIENMLTTADHG